MIEEFEENVIIDFVHVFETISGYMRHVEYSTGPSEYSNGSSLFEKCSTFTFQLLHENLSNSKSDKDQNSHFLENMYVL